jgi:hypothetical protein
VATPANPSPSKLPLIISIIQASSAALAAVEPAAAIVPLLLSIYQKGAALYESETGKPFDISKIPFEAKV